MLEKKLLRLLDNQPNEALAQVLQEYGGLLSAVTMNILHDPQDAEECIGDVLVQLWRTRDRIQNPARLKSYLCAIARNAALDRRRKQAPCRELSLQQELMEDYQVSGQMDDVLLTELVTGAIRQLGEPTADIFLRRYYREDRVKDIAADLGLTERAVESHLYRGKKRLKEILSEGGYLDEAQ